MSAVEVPQTLTKTENTKSLDPHELWRNATHMGVVGGAGICVGVSAQRQIEQTSEKKNVGKEPVISTHRLKYANESQRLAG